MRKIKAFLYVFYKSLTSPKYYADVLNAKLGLSFKYFFTLVFLISLTVFIKQFTGMVPKVREGTSTILTKTAELYADDLVITIEDGQLSINKPEPYVISTADAFGSMPQGDFPTNLIVFDSAGTIDDLTDTYNSFILVNSSNVLFRDNKGIKVESLEQVPNVVITKDDLLGLLDKLRGFAVYLPYLFGLVVFGGILFYFALLRFMSVLFVSLALFVFGKIAKFGFDYKRFLGMALHVVTAPLVLEGMIFIFDVNLVFPFWFFILSVILGAVVLFSLDKKSANV